MEPKGIPKRTELVSIMAVRNVDRQLYVRGLQLKIDSTELKSLV